MTSEAQKRATSGRPRDAVESALQRFGEFLRDAGLKFTTERREVLRALFARDEHVEAEELLMRLREQGSTVSRATIYRTLDLLVQAELARKVRLGTDHYYFEQILGRRQHEHMICIGCGEIIEWFDPELRRVINRNVASQGFEASRYSVQVFGHCARCAGS